MSADNLTSRPLNKLALSALEKVFAAEIHGRLPFQSKAKIFADLVADGMLQPMSRRYGSSPLGCVVSGYELTHAGRMAYGASCEDATDVR